MSSNPSGGTIFVLFFKHMKNKMFSPLTTSQCVHESALDLVSGADSAVALFLELDPLPGL